MSNQNFSYNNMDPAFHINIPKTNHSLPEAFQDDTDVVQGFSETNFQNPVDHYYQQEPASCPVSKEENPGMLVNPFHQSHSNPGISEPSIYNMGVSENNVYGNTLCSQDSSGQIGQSYCPEIPNQITSNASLLPCSESQQNSHEVPFVSNVSQSSTYSSQFLPEQFNPHNRLTSDLQASGDSGLNALLPVNPTEFVGASNANTDAYYPPLNVNSEDNGSMFTTYSGPLLETEHVACEADILKNTSIRSSSPTLPPVCETENVGPEADIMRNTSIGCPSPTLPPVCETENVSSGADIMQNTSIGCPSPTLPPVCETENMDAEADMLRNTSIGCPSPTLPPVCDPLENSVNSKCTTNLSLPGTDNSQDCDSNNIVSKNLCHSEATLSQLTYQKERAAPPYPEGSGASNLEEMTKNVTEDGASEISMSCDDGPSIELSDIQTQNLGENVDTCPNKADVPKEFSSEVDSTSESGNRHLSPVGDATVFKVEGTPSKEIVENAACSEEEIANRNAPDESLECITNSLEEGIEASKEHENNSPILDQTRPLSPMITLMDGDFGEGIDTFSLQSTDNNGDSENKIKVGESNENVRITRTKTGTPLKQTPRFIEEFGDSDDSSKHSVQMDEWEYEDGAELAPCKPDPTVTVHENVLKVTDEEFAFYKEMFKLNGVEGVLRLRLHCTACGKHVGAAPNYIHLGNRHKVLRVLTCNRCRSFYGIGQFTKDSDGSELYCRWCGQGGQVICCSSCPNVFCQPCIRRNFGAIQLNKITSQNDWACFLCNYKELWPLRAICWALLSYTMTEKKEALNSNDLKKITRLEEDRSKCCGKKLKKRKQPTRSSGTKNNKKTVSTNNTHQVNSSNANASTARENMDFGDHFLFGAGNFESLPGNSTAQENASEEDDYLDISQFVQPVLEEKSPNRSRNATMLPGTSQSSANSQNRIPNQVVGRKTTRSHTQSASSVSQQVMTSAGPRIVVRQQNLLQPGLKPINSLPNRMNVTIHPTGGARANMQGPPDTSKNTPNYLNNMDGVRSMDQLQSLNQVTWFRDGIDSIRAVGFALNKRIRDLEARFHSLKNKKDVEKVMVLGKKLNKLSTKTEIRFKQITSTMQAECRKWAYANGGDPFNSYHEAESDWDDERELSKPLEKVMIPVSVAALKNAGIRPPGLVLRGPPPLLRTGTPQTSLGARFPQTAVRPRAILPKPNFVQNQVRTVFQGRNHQSLLRPRVPTQNPAIRSRQFNITPNISVALSGNPDVAKVGAFINDRNGPNSVSISLTPPKRPRPDPDSDDDIQVCPTVPELIQKHNVKPCRVRLEKCDDFITTFLQNQQDVRHQNEKTPDEPEYFAEELPSNVSPITEAELVAALRSSSFVSCGENITTAFTEINKKNEDSDDDIEVIE